MISSTLQLMLEAAIAASTVILEVYARPIVAGLKADGSPVTEADARAEAIILEYLTAADLPVLAEESAADGRIPNLGERYFVVDPLDGTKEFLKRNGEFTVNIALIEHGVPTLGVLLAPVSGNVFFAGPDGAFLAQLVDGALTGTTQIHVDATGPMRIVASRSHGHAALGALCNAMVVESDISVGSSLKFGLLARGDAQLYPRFTPTCEWDTAAGQAVLEAAGGTVLTLDGAPLRYGKASAGYLNPFFVAAASAELARRAASEMRQALDATSG